MAIRTRPLDRLFISYSHVDVEFVDALTAILDELKVFYLRDTKQIDWGADIDASVSDALKSCSHLLVVLSPASESSAWVPYELGQARALNLVILPILTHPSLSLPSFLSGSRYLSTIADFRHEIESMSRRAIPVTVSLSVDHTQPAVYDEVDEDGYPVQWGVNHFEYDDNVEADSWIPSLAILARSETSYPIELKSGYFHFNPEIRLADNAYEELATQSRGGTWLSPGGKAEISFSPGPVTNAIARAIQNGQVEGFGVQTADGLRAQGSQQDLADAAEYLGHFFGQVDLDGVWNTFKDRTQSGNQHPDNSNPPPGTRPREGK